MNSLVGRDVNELLRPELPGSARHDQGTANVVGDGLGGVQLHERDVLVGGGVEDQMGPEAGEEGGGVLPGRRLPPPQPLPPAPVTSTRLPFMNSARASRSISTGWRPRRS